MRRAGVMALLLTGAVAAPAAAREWPEVVTQAQLRAFARAGLPLEEIVDPARGVGASTACGRSRTVRTSQR